MRKMLGPILVYGICTLCISFNLLANPCSQKLNLISWHVVDWTDPRVFDPSKFTLRVHSLSFIVPRSAEEQMHYLLRQENAPISYSVITSEKKATYSYEGGFIIEVPAANIIATYWDDMGPGRYVNSNWEEELQIRFGILSFEEFMTKSDPGFFNEVVASTGSGSNKIKVIGIFIWKSSKHYQEFRSLAEKYNLPVVELAF